MSLQTKPTLEGHHVNDAIGQLDQVALPGTTCSTTDDNLLMEEEAAVGADGVVDQDRPLGQEGVRPRQDVRQRDGVGREEAHDGGEWRPLFKAAKESHTYQTIILPTCLEKNERQEMSLRGGCKTLHFWECKKTRRDRTDRTETSPKAYVLPTSIGRWNDISIYWAN